MRRDRAALMSWARSVRNPLGALISLTYDKDELVQWRAIETSGYIAALYAKPDPERVRDIIRRLLWLMNDESGGLGWRSPELIGEILVNVPALVPEYAKLLLSFLCEEPFERGTHFAVYRVASVDSKPFSESVPRLSDSLSDIDPSIRGFAAMALGAMGVKAYHNAIQKLQEDQSQVRLYDFTIGQMRETTVREMAKQAIGNIGIITELHKAAKAP